MVGDAVEQRAGEALAGEDRRPFLERQVRCHDCGAVSVAPAEDVEQEYASGRRQGARSRARRSRSKSARSSRKFDRIDKAVQAQPRACGRQFRIAFASEVPPRPTRVSAVALGRMPDTRPGRAPRATSAPAHRHAVSCRRSRNHCCISGLSVSDQQTAWSTSVRRRPACGNEIIRPHYSRRLRIGPAEGLIVVRWNQDMDGSALSVTS